MVAPNFEVVGDAPNLEAVRVVFNLEVVEGAYFSLLQKYGLPKTCRDSLELSCSMIRGRVLVVIQH